MYERRSSIHSDVRHNDDDDDEQLLELTTPTHQGQNRISFNDIDEPILRINSPDEKDTDTENLIDEMQVDPPTTGTFLCSKTPARYAIAIWAFFGFFCLYAMRVNLSVAIVAMVR